MKHVCLLRLIYQGFKKINFTDSSQMDNWSDSRGSYFVLRPRAWRIKEKEQECLEKRHKPRNRNTSSKAFKLMM